MNDQSLTIENQSSEIKQQKVEIDRPTTFPKDYDGIKAYVENEQRQITHGGNFKLLTTIDEFQAELKAKRKLRNCKLRICQTNCGLHASFTIKHEEFFYRNRGCNECSKDSNYSYAHRYFQALLAAYGIVFLSEENVKGSRLRVDFYIPPINKSYEIDGLIHATVTRFHKDSEARLEKAKKRDQQKNRLLRNNLTRILLYEILPNGEIKSKSIETQFHLIREHFIDIYKEVTGHDIRHKEILAKQDSEFFYLNSRVQDKINKLKTIHGEHIQFEHSKNHAKILLNEFQKFRCTVSGKLFARKISSALNPFFVCPICVEKAKQENHVYYPLLEPVAKNMVEELIQLHPEIEFANPTDPFREAIVYNTVRVKMESMKLQKPFYLPLSQLRAMSTAKIIHAAKTGKYELKTLKKSRDSKKQKLFVNLPTITNREEENKKSELLFKRYRAAAMQFNKNLRNGLINSVTSEEINDMLPKYIHNCTQAATIAVARFEQTIIPFFAKHQDFQLLTIREQYAGTNMPLLLKHKCGSKFFATWSKLNKDFSDHSTTICQNEKCFSHYFKSKAVPGNKKSQAEILRLFSEVYSGHYFPKYPEQEIRVRTPIELLHLPTGETIKASLDNFRRGKFKGAKGSVANQAAHRLAP